MAERTQFWGKLADSAGHFLGKVAAPAAKAGAKGIFTDADGTPSFTSKTVQIATSDALSAALEDTEVQTDGAAYIQDQIRETGAEVRKNAGSILSLGRQKLEVPGDTRSVYDKIKTALVPATDPWYHKLWKTLTARLLALGVPVVSWVGASLTARITGKDDPSNPNAKADMTAMKSDFEGVFNGLLSRAVPNTP